MVIAAHIEIMHKLRQKNDFELVLKNRK